MHGVPYRCSVAFRVSDPVHIVFSLFNHLDKWLKTSDTSGRSDDNSVTYDSNEREKGSSGGFVNTKIVSASVGKRRWQKLKEPMRYVLEHNKVTLKISIAPHTSTFCCRLCCRLCFRFCCRFCVPDPIPRSNTSCVILAISWHLETNVVYALLFHICLNEPWQCRMLYFQMVNVSGPVCVFWNYSEK